MRKALLAVVLAACGGGSKQAATTPTEQAVTTVPSTPAETAAPAKAAAGAALEPRSGSKVTGMVTIAPMGDGVHVDVRIANATPGTHGLHFHDKGDCSAPDGKSAGDHWNPAGVAHGSPDATPHHAGDLGNIDVGADGTGSKSIHLPGLTVAPGQPNSVIGHAVIVHEKADDMTTQPSGNAGARIACGV